MLSEDITDKRADVTVRLMDALIKRIEDSKDTEAHVESLVALIIKSYELENFKSMVDEHDRILRKMSQRLESKNQDLGRLE